MISKHISEKEATKSVTALRLGIDNTPDGDTLNNMKIVAEKVFEPLREYVGGAIKINSFYRSPELCEAIGSKATSQHTKGEAIDIDSLGEKTNAELFYYIKDNLDYDQIIWEHGDDENPDWIHASYVSKKANRGIALQSWTPKGKKHTLYKYFNLDA